MHWSVALTVKVASNNPDLALTINRDAGLSDECCITHDHLQALSAAYSLLPKHMQ